MEHLIIIRMINQLWHLSYFLEAASLTFSLLTFASDTRITQFSCWRHANWVLRGNLPILANLSRGDGEDVFTQNDRFTHVIQGSNK